MVLSANLSPQRSVTELLKSKRTVSAEIIPPRNGAEAEAILKQISILREVPVDFISVTKGAGGSLRGGTLPIAQMIKDRFGICSLAHFTCRDYTIEEIENNLMDHHYFGVHNILALRGDPPDGQPDHFKTAPNRHSYAYQLVQQIGFMNKGKYIVRKGFDDAAETLRDGAPTKFCIGVAAHPEHEPFEEAIKYLSYKREMGAEFAITQMIFSAEPYARFVEGCKKNGLDLPIIPGLRIITQAATAERMVKKFGCKISQSYIDTLNRAKTKEEAREIGLGLTRKLCDDLIAAGAPGIHIFVMNDPLSAAILLKGLL